MGRGDTPCCFQGSSPRRLGMLSMADKAGIEPAGRLPTTCRLPSGSTRHPWVLSVADTAGIEPAHDVAVYGLAIRCLTTRPRVLW